MESIGMPKSHFKDKPNAATTSDPWRKVVLENALDAVIGMDQNQKIIDWNHQAELTFGWSKQEAIGRSLSETVIPVQYRAAHRDGVAHFLLSGEGPILNRRIEIFALHRNGTVFPVELTVIPILVNRSYFFYSFLRDISERKNLEAERDHLLQATREDQKLQSELSNIFARTSNVKHLISTTTETIAKRLNASRCWVSEINDETASATIHQDYTAPHLSSLKGMYSLNTFGPEMVASWRSGRVVQLTDVTTDARTAKHAQKHLALGISSFITVPLHRNGKLLAAFNVSTEHVRHWSEREIELARAVAENLWSVIENARLFNALQDQSNLTLSITTNAASCLFMMDKNGHPTFMNPAAEQVTGYKLEEIKNKPLHLTIHHAQVDFIERKNEEETFVRKDGSYFPVSFSVTHIKRDGEISGSVLEFRDITDQKNIENALREAVRVRDEFISICSHELKTPVTSMKLQFQMAERQLKKNDARVYSKDAVERRTKITIKQLDRMNNLIEDMLDVSRLATGRLQFNLEVIDLCILTAEIVERFSDQFVVLGVRIDFESCVHSVDIFGDRYRIEQVISNLLSNAMKYGAGKPIQVKVSTDKSHAFLTVTDQGIGISKENLERIFNRFERAISAANISGLGLGLYISQQIVEAHGGRIWAESIPNQGSIFTVELPLNFS